VTDDGLGAAALALATRLAADPGFSFGVTKKLFKAMAQPSLEAFLDIEAWAQEACLMTADHREGVAAYLEKRKPQFGRPSQGEAS